MLYVDPPFDLGETLDGTDADGTVINTHWEGQIFEFPHFDRSASSIRGSKSRLSGRQIKAVILRNSSGGALAVAALVLKGERDATNYLEVLGRTAAVAGDDATGPFYVGDHYLTTTVAANDLFWGIVEGPCKVTGSASIAQFDELASTAAGEVAAQTDDANDLNVIGTSLQALTDGNTGWAHIRIRY